jgi:hypothetical protein
MIVLLHRAIMPVVELRDTLLPQSESAKPSESSPLLPTRRWRSLKLGFPSRYPIRRRSAAHWAGPADAQNLATCEAGNESHLTQDGSKLQLGHKSNDR